MSRIIRKLVIHCSASRVISDAASIRKFHMDPPPLGRGWKDIGYHFVINREGTLEFGRSEDTIGAHCEGHNSDSIGICVGGDKEFTYSQLRTLRFIVREMMTKYKLAIGDVYMHNELDMHGKECPRPNDLVRALFLDDKDLKGEI